jgi:hypothetical protein
MKPSVYVYLNRRKRLGKRKVNSPQVDKFEACSICGLSMFEDASHYAVVRDYIKVAGTTFCHGCRDSFEAKVWRVTRG